MPSIASLICCLLLVAPAAPTAPPLRIADVNAGTVIAGRRLELAIPILDIEPTVTLGTPQSPCGCLSLVREGSRIFVRAATLNLPAGDHQWKIVVPYVYREAADSPPIAASHVVTLRATIVRPIRVEPVAIQLSGSGALEQTITVAGAAVNRFRTSLKGIDGRLSVQEGRTTLALTIAADQLPTGGNGEIFLDLDDPRLPEVAIPIHVTRPSPDNVRVLPESATLRFATGQKLAATRLQLIPAAGHAIEIQKIHATDDSIKVRATPGPGSRVTLRVEAERPTTAAETTSPATLFVRLAGRPQPLEIRVERFAAAD